MSAAEKAELFTELRTLSPGGRLALLMALKAETKKAKREQRRRKKAVAS